MKIKGLDDLSRKLKDLERNAKKLQGTHNVPLSELFSPSFIRRYTRFSSLDDLGRKAEERGFTLESQADWDNLPKDVWDAFIAEHSQFSSWQEMLNEGAADYTKRQLGFS